MGLYLELDLGSLATLGSLGLRAEEVLLLLALTLSSNWLKDVLPWKTDALLEGVSLAEG